jgi:Cu2+-exporting ATPase
MSLTVASGALPRETRVENVVCVHCGTPFVRTNIPQSAIRIPQSPPAFCCAGCEFVYKLILEHGLERFYDLRSSAVLPVKSLVFQKRDYRWLADLAAATPGTPARLTLELQGVSCIGCVWLIERLFLRRPGAVAVQVNSALGQITLRWLPGRCDLTDFARDLQGFGYLLGPPGQRTGKTNNAFAIRMGVCGAFALNSMLFTIPRYLGMQNTFQYAGTFDRLALAFATLSFCVGGSYFFGRAWSGVRRGWFHIDLPISLGLAAAYAGSILAWSRHAMNFAYFDFVSIFTFLMLAGRWTQQMAIEKNRNRLLGMQADVLMVTLSKDGKRVPASQITPGVQYSIDPSQVVPVRSKLSSDAATLGLDWINGEPETRATRCGQLVAAGSVNCTQTPITLVAIESWEDSLLNALLNEKPREKETGAQSGRFIKWYVITVSVLAVAGFCGWALAGRPLLMAWQVLVSTLVVSCPCASGVALPLADELAASRLRRRGVFVREQSLWAKLARVRKVLFDKTGTLTLETMELRDSAALSSLDTMEKSILLALVQDNLHPASCCLRELLMAARIQPAMLGQVREETGCGIEAATPGGLWRLGRPDWAAWAASEPAGEEGCVLSRDGIPIAHFHFEERARPGAASEIAWLQQHGYTISILSGDGAEKVRAMAAHLGLPQSQCLGGMSPRGKQDFVRNVDDDDTLMIGDGANDSLAFNESWCSGTPAIDRGLLQSKSDFYFVGRGLAGIRELLLVAAQRRATTSRVVGFAIAYNIAAITIAMAGHMNPVLAAILMPASSVVALALVALGLRERPTAQKLSNSGEK